MRSPHELKNGDRLVIGQYIVAVSLDGDAPSLPRQAIRSANARPPTSSMRPILNCGRLTRTPRHPWTGSQILRIRGRRRDRSIRIFWTGPLACPKVETSARRMRRPAASQPGCRTWTGQAAQSRRRKPRRGSPPVGQLLAARSGKTKNEAHARSTGSWQPDRARPWPRRRRTTRPTGATSERRRRQRPQALRRSRSRAASAEESFVRRMARAAGFA